MAETILIFCRVMALMTTSRQLCRDGSCGLGHGFEKAARILSGATLPRANVIVINQSTKDPEATARAVMARLGGRSTY